MKRRFVPFAAFILLCMVAGSCGESSGACVTGDDALCEEGWDKAECEAGTGWRYYTGKSCADVGYTKPCSASEGAGCFCRATDTACP